MSKHNIIMQKYILSVLLLFLSGCSIYAQNREFGIIQNAPISYPDSIIRYECGKTKTKKINYEKDIYHYLSAYPIEQIWEKAKWLEHDKIAPYLRTSNGMNIMGLYYKIHRDNELITICSTDDLQKHFTPIQDEMMALAYAYIYDEYIPMSDFSFLTKDMEKYEQIVKLSEDAHPNLNMIMDYWQPHLHQIETSYVKAVDGGYEMLLYQYHLARGYSSYSVHKIFLHTDGKLDIINSETAMQVFTNTHWD